MTVGIKLHCPCGVVEVTVPVTQDLNGRMKSYPERAVSFVNVDSWATGIDIRVALPEPYRWPELGVQAQLTVDMCYGGAFYCVVDAEQLGFSNGLQAKDLEALSRATAKLKEALKADPQYRVLFQHPDEEDLSFLYGVIVRDTKRGRPAEGAAGAEVGLCFFGDQQVDRSPCGSGSAARRALAHAKHAWPPEQKWTYHSLLSDHCHGVGGFTTHVVGQPASGGSGPGRVGEAVRVVVEGQAFYTGFATFLVEAADVISPSGFMV
jgi:trans-L-3-hydroxyproline dehydratase